MIRTILALVLCVMMCAPASPTRAADTHGAFVMLALGDTIALERYAGDERGVSGVLLFRLAGLRMDYRLELGPDQSPVRFHSEARAVGTAPPALALQSATLEWRADTVFAEVHPAPPRPLASRAGSIPYLNPSVFLLEALLNRSAAHTPPLDSVPVFAVAGGATFMVAVLRPAPDSALISFNGVTFGVHLRGDGRIESGGVAAQGVTFHRVDDLPEALLSPPPSDYSAPADAPYTSEGVNVPTRAGFTLAGTLTRPRGAGRPPVVVTLTGSGPQDRDEAIPLVKGFRPFRQIADTLSRRGIAVLRLDDRGVGGSGGRFAGSTTADFAADAEDALRWLAQRADLDSDRVALLGHSEGGLIAPLVAKSSGRVAAMVLLAAPAWTGRRVLDYQMDRAARRTHHGAALDSTLAAARHAADSLASADPWFAYFVRHDPLPVARRLASPPVLILQGATDRQVTAQQSKELAAAFRAAGNRDVTRHVLPATNHLFLPDPDGDPSGYVALTTRELPRATLGLIADWLSRRLRVAPR